MVKEVPLLICVTMCTGHEEVFLLKVSVLLVIMVLDYKIKLDVGHI